MSPSAFSVRSLSLVCPLSSAPVRSPVLRRSSLWAACTSPILWMSDAFLLTIPERSSSWPSRAALSEPMASRSLLMSSCAPVKRLMNSMGPLDWAWAAASAAASALFLVSSRVKVKPCMNSLTRSSSAFKLRTSVLVRPSCSLSCPACALISTVALFNPYSSCFERSSSREKLAESSLRCLSRSALSVLSASSVTSNVFLVSP
mmetsp:Transcript_49467/g.105743  ORF Transcript_49467/g.105743 Transcript_49467/m.105743 type:complete len:203 (-) Transcript_49467:644-1252(-)